MDETYEIRVLGFLGPALRAAFDGVRCELVPRQTMICGRLSRDELHVLLQRLDKVGLMLTRLDCLPAQEHGCRGAPRRAGDPRPAGVDRAGEPRFIPGGWRAGRHGSPLSSHDDQRDHHP